ncbi:MAG TPA: hypothetical protein VEB59_16065 [Gemmatimonadales bacterium]|nr:hypothetical protein [Gemmatimonadales bacterium]
MSRSLRFRPCLSLPATVALALAATALPATRGEAQGSASTTAAKPKAGRIPEYRLTEPMVRKVSAILSEWDPTPSMADRMFVSADPGMPKEDFEALPDSQQVMILIESQRRAEEKYKEGERQLMSMAGVGLAEGVAAAEGIPALKAAYRKAGLSASEFVTAYNAYNGAMTRSLTEEFGPQPPLPAGIRRDNAVLFETMSKTEALWTPLGLTNERR